MNRATFFHFEDLVDIIVASHHLAKERHKALGSAGNPLLGHDVQVSNMWQVRDLWNWLAPG